MKGPKLVSKTPTMAVDGFMVSLGEDPSGDPSLALLTFYQAENPHEGKLNAVGVASVELPLESLKDLKDTIEDIFTDIKKKKR